MNADLLALEADPADAERLKSVFRVAHTLKGAARAAAVAPIEEGCHAMEALLTEAATGNWSSHRRISRSCSPRPTRWATRASRLQPGRDLADSPARRAARRR